ncbi:TolB family protein [Emticicia fontis]
MQRLTLFIICFVTFFINACQKKNEPAPPEPNNGISSVTVSSRKINGIITLDISAFALDAAKNPKPTTFEQAEVWISEELSGYTNMKLATTTTTRTVKLENLKADKTYYLAVKGMKNGTKTDFSPAIMFSTRSLQPVETLLDFPFNFGVSGSALFPYLSYVDIESGKVILRNWKTKVDTVIFTNSASKSYLIKGFYGLTLGMYLETTKNTALGFDSYGLLKDKDGRPTGKYGITEMDMPSGARIWNCAFSPDGRRMAYTDYNKPGLFVYDTILDESYMYFPETFFDFYWSADGKNIIQTRNIANASLDAREVVKWDLGDPKKAPEKIFNWPDEIESLSFSPTQEYVLFISNVSNNADLWIYDLKSAKTWQISDVNGFGWLSEKEFFVSVNKTDTQTSWKTYRYTMP